jgi:D-serine deaminase-like pyridoxal phosphate-dependent protein
VSQPADELLCLDLGHKSIAAEMPHPRLRIPELNDFTVINHNEEHLVIRTNRASLYNPGDILYAVPWHICPTVPRYPFAYTVDDHRISGMWKVDARDRVVQP